MRWRWHGRMPLGCGSIHPSCREICWPAERTTPCSANLPYVSTASELAPEVSVYEPAEALYAGDDGLQVLRRLISMLDGV